MTSAPTFSPKQLSADEIRAFMKNGYLLLRAVFSNALIAQIVPRVWLEMPESPSDSTTWTQPIRIIEKVLENLPIDEILTARYRASLDDLCGAGRWETNLGVGYWVNLFPEPVSSMLRPQAIDWHIDTKADGQSVNSADLGLSIMEYFSDIDRSGGGTAIRVGSHRAVARMAAKADFQLTADELSERVAPLTGHLPVVQITARAGDVLLMHPFTLHAASSNITQQVRIAANRPISLIEPINFNRTDSRMYSPVEWAVVNALDCARERERPVR